jgi:hypothetical protein
MNYRIGEGKKWFILIIAIIIDAIEIIVSPTIIVAIFSGILQYTFIWGMFAINGVKFFGTAKKIKRNVVSGVLESIPFIEMLPIFTWNVWKTIEDSREEDRLVFEQEGASQNQNILRQKRQISEINNKNQNIIRVKKS